ncbi:anthranilate synthase [Sphingomonas melonis TY]|jgi:anthranilate synthase component I|uniref:Anthranilate synthase component 1 n=1 Tax=Sphingomonas melonis TY TaxID=621456 RepID=A0A154NAW5_9SPHN|nr:MULTISPECIES: anthranilate synthase component I [Sphingomonas]AOW23870.1 anthranilate synthase component I [Sphingomonas melonis TY]ATI54890.1 anthranilate synthase component I [Sphingomonas melonis]KZB96731.1 anthranilate synthase [Sphingomonas melonis TY]MBI0532602.1 anthranilate synthase component I [Sphingomonas sp. TX0522]MBX8843351.1 anthranilate synthase component I [Sphingomonas melonis]
MSASAAAIATLAAGRPAFVWRRQVADTETPVAAALKLIEPGRGDFLLESVEGGATRGRHSLIGLAPDLVFRAHGDTAEINRHWATDRTAFQPTGTPTLAALRALVAECQGQVPAELPRALACLVGYFGYETIGLVERLDAPAADPLGLPDMLFVRPTVICVFDRLADALYLVAPVWPDATRTPEKLVAAAEDRLDDVAARLAHTPLPAPVTADPEEPAYTPAIAPQDYATMVTRAQDYIAAGDIFQVVLAQRFSAPFALPPFELYRSLRRINPSPFLYHLDLPGFALIGSSPEILVRVRDGQVTIRPIAGTRPRGKTAAEDEANRESLLADPKERAEHLMLLDLGRNDVGRAAAPGTVRVTSSYGIELYSHVMHIVSNVVGDLSPAADAIDALFAGFPAGTVSGAPKVRACQIIAELEPERRGAYAGGVGYFSPDGSMDSCIVLRTAIVKDGTIHAQAGAGIVADSVPAYEQRECEAKAGAILAAARDAVARAADGQFGQ